MAALELKRAQGVALFLCDASAAGFEYPKPWTLENLSPCRTGRPVQR
jgi:hypothetical protein